MYLTYVQRFDIIPQSSQSGRRPIPDPVTGMYVLKRARRADQSYMGDIIPLTQFRMPVQLIPRFGAVADRRLTMETSLEYSNEFFLNRFFDKDTFCYLLKCSTVD